jgi:hypothetical protein
MVVSFGNTFSLAANTPQYAVFAAATSLAGGYSVTNSAQFALMQAVYEEFRVLGLEVIIAPTYTATVDTQPIVIFPRREPQDALDVSLSFAEVGGFQGMTFCNLVTPTKKMIKMSGTPEANWLSTDVTNNIPAIHTGFGIWSDITIDVYAQLVWRVQFRSTKSTTASMQRVRGTLPKTLQVPPESGDDDGELVQASAADDDDELGRSILRRVKAAIGGGRA